jgi:hypothetical protein
MAIDLESDQEFAARYPGTPVTVYQHCRQVARARMVVTYDELNQACALGLDFGNPSDRSEISAMLGDVSEFEVGNGRPMLSAVVVLKDSHPLSPGAGFFDWADTLRVPRGAKEDNQLFHARILRDLFAYWKDH